MSPLTFKVNSWAWVQIVEATERYAVASEEHERSQDALHEVRGKARRRAARRIFNARNDRDALARSLAGLLLTADLPEGVAVLAGPLTVWYTIGDNGDLKLGTVTTAIVEPVGGY